MGYCKWMCPSSVVADSSECYSLGGAGRRFVGGLAVECTRAGRELVRRLELVGSVPACELLRRMYDKKD